MAATDTSTAIVAALVESYKLNYAFASLLFYDYILCFSEEVDYFWTGPWSLSRILYLAIRYLSLAFAFFSIIADRLSLEATSSTDTILLVKLFVFIIPISILCQSVITLRIWFLFSRTPAVKIFAVALLFATSVTSVLLVALQWNLIQSALVDPPLSASSSFAWVYVPSLVFHSILFALKVYRFLTSSVRMKTDTLLWGFIKEGMFMYVFATASLLFGVVGLSMVEPSQLPVRMPAAIASPIVTAIVVSVCRVMFSIRSVAATAHVDPEWLLNHAELSRVHWRQGNVDGEIIVEMGELVNSRDTKFPYPP